MASFAWGDRAIAGSSGRRLDAAASNKVKRAHEPSGSLAIGAQVGFGEKFSATLGPRRAWTSVAGGTYPGKPSESSDL